MAIIGRPNAGKSTFLNYLLGQKILMTSSKVQATRFSTRVCINIGETQLVLIDTPGIIEPKNRLQYFLMKNAKKSLRDLDFALVLIDVNDIIHVSENSIEEHRVILRRLKRSKNCKIIFLISKVDSVETKPDSEAITSYIHNICYNEQESVSDERDMSERAAAVNAKDISQYSIFLISVHEPAMNDQLVDELCRMSPQREWLYEEEDYTDLTERVMAEELTRESIYENVRKEIPYNSSVKTELWKENGKEVTIHQIIYVLRNSQKIVMIGHKGEMIKKIGEAAKHKVSEAMGMKVHLFLRVKIKEDWIEKLPI